MRTAQELYDPLFEAKPGHVRYLGTAGGPARLTCGVSRGAHSHIDLVNQHYDIIYILDGMTTYVDATGASAELGGGSVYQRVPGMRHSTIGRPEAPPLSLYLSLPAETHAHFVEIGVLKGGQEFFHPGARSELVESFLEFDRAMEGDSAADFFLALSMGVRFLADVVFYDAHRADNQDDGKLRKAKELLGDSRHKGVPLAEIAGKVGMGYESFRKRFKELEGVSPQQYRARREAETAAALLKDGELTVSHVAQELGFKDVFGFSRQFKRATGVSPAQYRHMNG